MCARQLGNPFSPLTIALLWSTGLYLVSLLPLPLRQDSCSQCAGSVCQGSAHSGAPPLIPLSTFSLNVSPQSKSHLIQNLNMTSLAGFCIKSKFHFLFSYIPHPREEGKGKVLIVFYQRKLTELIIRTNKEVFTDPRSFPQRSGEPGSACKDWTPHVHCGLSSSLGYWQQQELSDRDYF